jgi:uncharacterized protein (TIGR00369 family)
MSDPQARVAASFARQSFMATLGATLERVEPGFVEIAMPITAAVAQQHGYVHAGALATVGDSACGYAALSVMSHDAAVLSIEFKINMLAPASGERVVARARVIRAGRTIVVTAADVFAEQQGTETLVATMTGTMMAVQGRGLAD